MHIQRATAYGLVASVRVFHVPVPSAGEKMNRMFCVRSKQALRVWTCSLEFSLR